MIHPSVFTFHHKNVISGMFSFFAFHFLHSLLYKSIGEVRVLYRGTRSLKAPRAVRQQNKVISPVGLGAKGHCAGEDQPQFSSQVLWIWNLLLYWRYNRLGLSFFQDPPP
jgi:hypothetical protein